MISRVIMKKQTAMTLPSFLRKWEKLNSGRGPTSKLMSTLV